MRRIYIFLAVLLAIPLAACGDGGGVRSTPYQQLGARVTHASDVNNQTAVEAQDTLRCPRGMKPIEHEVRITNDTSVEYKEEHGRSGGRSSRGRLSGSYATYSGADVTVEAETETRSEGEIRCVSIIDLTPAPPR